MNYVRYRIDGEEKYGLVEGDLVRELTGNFLLPDSSLNGQSSKLEAVQLLLPVQPSKVVCVGLNYYQHAQEMNLELPEEPVLFLKPPTSVLAPYGEISLPPASKQVDYEAELAIVIGKTLRRVSEVEAVAGIFGYTCANDVTARDLQKKDGQWTRAKSFDTFCPLGPWVTTDLEPGNLDISLTVNGSIKQFSNTGDFITPVPQLISYISQVMTLLPGDIVLTGTPAGIGPLQDGDEVVVHIDQIGSLVNYARSI